MRNFALFTIPGLLATVLAGCEPSTTIGGDAITIPVGGDTADQGDGMENTSDDPTRESNGTGGGNDDDNGSSDTRPACLDADGDGYGDPTESPLSVSELVDGYVFDCSDCNDDSSSVHPGASDTTADGVDQDCNGVDASESVSYTWYKDGDGDGYGDPNVKAITSSPTAPTGYVAGGADCDDTNANVNPGKTEVAGNGLNDDCNSATSDTAASTWYRDADGDGYGTSATSTSATSQPSGYVANSTDCNDSSASVNPGKTEVTGNGVDDDCNSATSDTATSSTCASGTSLITGSFTAPSGATVVSISGMADGTGTLVGEFSWNTLADGTPSGMDITKSSNVVSFSYATCLDDAATVNMSVYYTMSGSDHWDCEASAFTGTWAVYRDGGADTATVSSNGGGGCDMSF